MPVKMWIPRVETDPTSGISVEWTKTAQRLDFYGWYNTHVGIEGDSMTLREFFDALGITEKDCAKAWRNDGHK